MIPAAETDKMYKDLMDMNVCSHDSNDVMSFYMYVQLLSNPKTIEELQIKHFTELCRKYTGIHFSLEISLNWLVLHSIAQQPQEIFL